MEFAKINDKEELWNFYNDVITQVNKTDVSLGWNIDVYPNDDFIEKSITNNELCIIRDEGKIVAAAVVNHNVNVEYDDIDWEIKGPKEKIATIHALAVSVDKRGSKISYKMLEDIEEYCRSQGDVAIHLDVIDTNIPAYKLYTRNGYTEVDCIKMFYEVVGTREFWMMERVIN